jgi:hypothetical protein
MPVMHASTTFLGVCQQVAEALLRHKERDGTVSHDGTSKLGQSYAGFQIHLADETYSLGAVAVSDGTSQTMFSAFYQRIERIMASTGARLKNLRRDVVESLLKLKNSAESSVMPCCGVTYDADGGYHVVQCTRCCEWVHISELGTCPGAGISYNTARSRKFVFVCRICIPLVGHV